MAPKGGEVINQLTTPKNSLSIAAPQLFFAAASTSPLTTASYLPRFGPEGTLRSLKSILPLLFAFSSLALAQGTFTQIDYPGAFSTQAIGIDKAGNISGWYQDQNVASHGFVYRNGTYTSIDYPGTTGGTMLFGMNDNGQIVGSGGGVCFVYNMNTQTFTTIHFPDAESLSPFAINNAGVIVGQVETAGTLFGFALKGKQDILLEPPGSFLGTAIGISTSGRIVGFASDLTGNLDFEYANGRYAQVQMGASTAQVYGINPAGTAVVGTFIDKYGDNAGFIYNGKKFVPIQYESAETVASGMNTAGQIVGFYGFIGAENLHGFLWNPPSEH